jgi:RNA polymerase sigma factor (sigma-70 family)
MKELNNNVELIQAIRDGDSSAFTELVRRYQHVAYASACALLKDFDLAHDAVQESFLTAYYQLHRLKQPEAFPAWLNKIVMYACHRIIRKRSNHNSTEPQESMRSAAEKTPEQLLEDKERHKLVLDTLSALPDHLREVVFLFYIEERSQEEVAQYLGVRKSTVNNRLYSARKKLRRRMIDMVKDTFKDKRLKDDFADNIAEIVRVQGSVVEASLGRDQRPLLFDQWVMADDHPPHGPQFTVVQRDVNGRIRLTSSRQHKSIRIGSKIIATGEQSEAQPLDDFLEDIVDTISSPRPEFPTVLETGIKIIDLMSPLPLEGTIGVLGTHGVGKAILLMELHHRLKTSDGHLSILYFASPQEAISIRLLVDREPGFPSDANGTLETSWLVTTHATDPEYARSTQRLDAAVYMSPLISCRGLYPAVDCLYSSSLLLQSGTVGKDHLEVIERVHNLLSETRKINHDPLFFEHVANGAYTRAKGRYRNESDRKRKSLSREDQLLLTRSKKLELFLTQPFYTTESFSGIKGVTVPLQETISGCTAILDGTVDDVPTEAFAFKGTLGQIRKEAAGQ